MDEHRRCRAGVWRRAGGSAPASQGTALTTRQRSIKSTSAGAHADCWMLRMMRGGPAEVAGRRAAHRERMLVKHET
jgi:hypothetical protein